jgi:hypothetical protein
LRRFVPKRPRPPGNAGQSFVFLSGGFKSAFEVAAEQPP